MNVRDALRKAGGLLFELPPEEPNPQPSAAADELEGLLADLGGKSPQPSAPRTAEQIVRAAEGPNLDEIRVSATPDAPVLTEDGSLDAGAIYRQAGLPKPAFSAEQMLEMLANLPANLPLDTKRQTVKVTLGALGEAVGASPETIVADASRKLAALASCVDSLSRETGEFVATAELEIAALQAQVEEKRRAIQEAKTKQQRVSELCDRESDRLDDVLEFFSLDVPPSKYAQPGS